MLPEFRQFTSLENVPPWSAALGVKCNPKTMVVLSSLSHPQVQFLQAGSGVPVLGQGVYCAVHQIAVPLFSG